MSSKWAWALSKHHTLDNSHCSLTQYLLVYHKCVLCDFFPFFLLWLTNYNKVKIPCHLMLKYIYIYTNQCQGSVCFTNIIWLDQLGISPGIMRLSQRLAMLHTGKSLTGSNCLQSVCVASPWITEATGISAA